MNPRGPATDDVDAEELPRTAPRRPWFLIAASLALAALVVVLWFRWVETRAEATRLRAELKEVYAEAEKHRLEAAQAQQRAAVLERELQTLRTRREAAPPEPPRPSRPRRR